MSRKKPSPIPDLRAAAESALSLHTSEVPEDRPRDDLLHELQVHRIELEMQNEFLRQSQLALEESRDRYADLYEFAPVGYISLDSRGLISQTNLTGATLLGVDRKKLLGRLFSRFVMAKDRENWQKSFARLFRFGGKDCLHLALRRPDASTVDLRLDCLFSGDTKPGLRVVLTDITDLKRAVIEQQRIADRLHLAKASTGLGIYDRDMVTGESEWDERTREIWGIGPDDPVGYEQFMAGVHPDDRLATCHALELAQDPQGKGEYRAEYRVINRADNSVRLIAANGQVFFRDGRPVRLVGTVKDISDQNRMEMEMQKRRREMELLLSQQVAAQTAAAIAHELNQPLVSISAYSEAALRMLHSGRMTLDKLTHALEGAMEQAHRAGRTLHELLDFLHKGEATMELVDINAVIRESIAIASESGYGGFRPVTDLEPNLPLVRANRLQLQKVVLNILHNAVQAMREAGVPTAAIVITVRTLSEHNMAQVTVRDSGPGLDAETAHRVFEPFFTTKPEGMGLGLAISRALVEAHGGQLWAELDSGPGATFHFTLPFAS